MDILLLIALVLLGWLLGSAALLFLIGTLHEGGHALAALLLQPGPVTVYLGSYGRPTGNWPFQLGRLRVYVSHTSIWWRGGCCQAPGIAQAGRWQEGLFIVAGPLLPLLVAGAVAWIVHGPKPAFAASAYVPWLVGRTVAAAALALAGLGAVGNLLPRRKPTVLADGRLIPSDGQLLLNVWRRPRLTAALTTQLHRAEAHRLAGEYAESAELYLAILPQAQVTYPLLRSAIHVLCQAGRYAEALALSTRHQREFSSELTDDDRFGHALLLSRTNQHTLALAAYTALIEQPVPYLPAYGNRGYTYNLLGEHELAIADFNYVLAAEPQNGYAHSNRGLSLCKLGQPAAGLAELQTGIQADHTNAYCHLNLGIYYYDRGEYSAAMACFEQARQHDLNTHQLAEYERKARLRPESSGVGGQMLLSSASSATPPASLGNTPA